MYQNGSTTARASNLSATGNFSGVSAQTFGIGKMSAGYFLGKISEMIIYNRALNTTEQTQINIYLGAKWGFNFVSGLIPYLGRPPFLKVFVPKSVTNCVLWLDADDSSTITASGSAVSAWKDKISGLSFTGTALIGTTRFNSRNTISLRRASSHYLFNSAFSYGISDRTTIFVWKADSTDTGNNGILSFASPYGSDYNSVNAITISTGYPIGGWGPAYIDAYSTFSGYATPNNQQTTSAIFTEQNAAQNQTLYKNGSQVNIYSAGGGLIGLSQAQSSLTPSTGLVLGARYQANYSYLTGYGSVDIAEVLCFSPSLSAFQRRQVEVYLANKWGLTGSLPEDHKFYTNFSPYIIV
jgi:hypothetical protein